MQEGGWNRIQDERLADHVRLYRRGNELIASFDLAGPGNDSEARIRAAIVAERERMMTVKEHAGFVEAARALHEHAVTHPLLADDVKERIERSFAAAIITTHAVR